MTGTHKSWARAPQELLRTHANIDLLLSHCSYPTKAEIGREADKYCDGTNFMVPVGKITRSDLVSASSGTFYLCCSNISLGVSVVMRWNIMFAYQFYKHAMAKHIESISKPLLGWTFWSRSELRHQLICYWETISSYFMEIPPGGVSSGFKKDISTGFYSDSIF